MENWIVARPQTDVFGENEKNCIKFYNQMETLFYLIILLGFKFIFLFTSFRKKAFPLYSLIFLYFISIS